MNIFDGLPENYFRSCRNSAENLEIQRDLLTILAKAKRILVDTWRAPYSALEFGVFDLWAKISRVSLSELVFGC